MGVVKLPKRINAVRVVTYVIDDELLSTIQENDELPSKEGIDTERVLDYLEDHIYEDINNIEISIQVQDEWGEVIREL
jgi:hypothetical protein